MPKFLKNSIKYIVSGILTLVIIFNYSSVFNIINNLVSVSAFINMAPGIALDFLAQNNNADIFDNSLKTETESSSSKTKKTDNEQNSNENKTVATATSGKVLGKIEKKDLANSGANTSYKNIYFNNCTGTKINIKELLNSNINFSVSENDAPQVLIYHTHATECFMSEDKDCFTNKDKTRTTDKAQNMVAVGDVMAEEIKKQGFSVLHDTTLHDYPSYTGSYDYSAKTIKNYLEKYPSIKIIIDLHRDSIGTETLKTAPTTKINGRNAAQVMLVMGSNTGYIDNYPNWKENLKLATKLQQTFNNKYPGLSRALLLRSSLYNQNLSKGAMLIEIGTEANTLQEAKYSAELVGKSLAAVMKGIEK